jgi:DNA-binding MarR family transcriptional regulator
MAALPKRYDLSNVRYLYHRDFLVSRKKREVFERLLDEVRGSQNATARFDQAVADAAGLNRTDMRIIDALDREGAVPAGRLAEVTGLSSGAMTTALDRLEGVGYARRVRDPGDRRRVLVEPTDRVRTLHGLYAEHAAYAERLYQRHSLEQLELLLQFFREGREFNERRAAELETASRRRGAGG